MDKKITVNILGTCLSRDTFSMHADDGKYEVLQYGAEFDPFYFTEKGIEIDKEAYDKFPAKKPITNFKKRCLFLDATKTVMDYIKEKDSDFLMIDAALFRVPSQKIGKTHITLSKGRKRFCDELKKNGIIKKSISGLVYTPYEEYGEKIKGFTGEVLKVYKPEQIIIMDTRCNYTYYDGNKLQPFTILESIDEKDKRMQICFEALKEQLKGCHVIPMLDASMSDSNHWLGLAIMHFTKEYYDYTYACLNVITEGLPHEEEERKINELKKNYELFYYKKFYNMLGRTLVERNLEYEATVTAERRKKDQLALQAKLMSSIILSTKNKPEPTVDIRSASLYGWSQLGELLLCIMKDNNVKPVAVIENLDSKVIAKKIIKGGVPVLKRDSEMPVTDCIVIADLMNAESTIQKLRSITDTPVYSAEEFIGFFKDLSHNN